MMITKHENFKISNAGLFIDDVHSFLGASPVFAAAIYRLMLLLLRVEGVSNLLR